ncbi:TfoX/Sxy family protein [Xanthobacter sp. KR7-65]|uniref:TfoX/Sxy family protein n=1 Tax=Xanthobacter sp. KR7-65 TaxID=3156612 RepID=UPI0032B5FE9F
MDADLVADLFAAFGPVSVKRMFGGAGLYADGLMFAVAVRDIIYLKADAALAAELAARGSAPFSYEAKGAVRTMNGFWSVPEAALDDSDDLATLARRALAVARSAQASKAEKPAKSKTAGKTGAKTPARGTEAVKAQPGRSASRRKAGRGL